MPKKKKYQLPKHFIELWSEYEALNEAKPDIMKRRFLRNYPIEERIKFLQAETFARNNFWAKVRSFLPDDLRGKDLHYSVATNTVELLEN